MLARSNTPYILLACILFDVGTHTPYILLACTIFDVGTVKHTLYFVSVYYI